MGISREQYLELKKREYKSDFTILKYQVKTKPVSETVDKFPGLCISAGLPLPVKEYKFCEYRRFRFDYAFVEQKVAVEKEGGIYTHQAHGSITGILRDLEKYSLAAELGWRVLRYLPNKIDYEQIKRTLNYGMRF